MTKKPLEGLRVISFEQFGAAPYASMFLADFGAEIIKVESAQGDYARQTGPQTLGDGDSLYYQCFNLNKKSLVLNLKDADDRQLFETMVSDCDAVINNLRGSLPAKLGIDYPSLKSIKPAIVCGHISAYGRDTSRADWPGYDFLMQAEAGIMSVTGDPDAEPTRIGLSMIDYMTGMMLAYGVTSAVLSAGKTGEGMDIDAALFDTAVHQLAYQGTWYLNEGIVTPKLARAAHPSSTPVQLYKTADGWIYICCMNQNFWELLLTLIDRSDLGEDPRFATMAARTGNRDALGEVLDGIFSTQASTDWMQILKGKIPAAPVLPLDEAVDNPFLEEIEMINRIDHSSGRELRMFSNPIKIDGKRPEQQAAPALDEHGDALREKYRSS
ncbi:L-carnitine dehydratase/bile acid-inducible protein F [Luminiphilus syltensis NOR5-1B]|uniref:L-carnitine dehydratase/bile acid-inducible protein F n=1 Tax=Luminiphilus syltensis NOR5-1B TaxID=565045 RepID=B8KU01_9GAMM|nr:CoA transferase [Luminiphilus syltensis]EED35792.1 L-carnitine dehydratase/bile acid-inducible protein F [Luminiphilus syltensis NOR5-1B]